MTARSKIVAPILMKAVNYYENVVECIEKHYYTKEEAL
jgi:hypothetical protein